MPLKRSDCPKCNAVCMKDEQAAPVRWICAECGLVKANGDVMPSPTYSEEWWTWHGVTTAPKKA